MTVTFWNYSKKSNSTARPSGTAAGTFDVKLKDACGILHPVLEIYKDASFNPFNFNYAYIATWSRYYFVSDWQWILGRWECTLSVDALATFRTEIGTTQKYILRCSYESTPAIIDTQYPVVDRKTVTKRTENVGFAQDMLNGIFVLGIINPQSSNYGSVGYYGVNAVELSALNNIMFPNPDNDNWASVLTGLTDTILRSIYDPWQYMVSCEWFPYYDSSSFDSSATTLHFGNFDTQITGYKLKKFSYFPEINFNMYLPTGFVNLPARERCAAFNSLVFHLEPWGNIELNLDDITLYSQISVYIKIDYVSGNGLLQIYHGPNRTNGDLIAESTTKLSSMVQLTATNTNASGVLHFATDVVTSLAGGGTSGVVSGLRAAGGALDALTAAGPSLTMSSGRNQGFNFLDGVATLTLRQAVFPDEMNSELGRPLYLPRTIGNIPGYIKCADSDIEIPGFSEEITAVENALIGGFYFE